MEKLIGDKKLFAVGIDIIKYEPSIWSRTCLWINNNQIGDFEDENILVPFIRSLMRIAVKNEGLWFDEFEGLNCREIFTTINPFYENPESFYDLPAEEQEKYVKYDIFLFQFGENFDSWTLYPVVKGDICKFIWNLIEKKGENEWASGDMQCFDVSLKDIQEVYKQFCKLIPDRYWPTRIEKLE